LAFIVVDARIEVVYGCWIFELRQLVRVTRPVSATGNGYVYKRNKKR